MKPGGPTGSFGFAISRSRGGSCRFGGGGGGAGATATTSCGAASATAAATGGGGATRVGGGVVSITTGASGAAATAAAGRTSCLFMRNITATPPATSTATSATIHGSRDAWTITGAATGALTVAIGDDRRTTPLAGPCPGSVGAIRTWPLSEGMRAAGLRADGLGDLGLRRLERALDVRDRRGRQLRRCAAERIRTLEIERVAGARHLEQLALLVHDPGERALDLVGDRARAARATEGTARLRECLAECAGGREPVLAVARQRTCARVAEQRRHVGTELADIRNRIVRDRLGRQELGLTLGQVALRERLPQHRAERPAIGAAID